MDEREQIEHFENDLHKLIDRYRAEYDMTIASVAGTLEVVKQLIIKEAGDDE